MCSEDGGQSQCEKEVKHELVVDGEVQRTLEKQSTEEKSSEKSDTSDIQIKAETAAPQCTAPDPSPTAVQASVQIPFVCITEGKKDMFNGLYQVYRSTGGGFATFGLIPQAIPPFLPANRTVFPCENGSLLPQELGQIAPNQPIFLCDRPSLTGASLSATDMLASTSKMMLLSHLNHDVLRHRRRLQTVNCHENSRCVNCKTTNTSLWRRNEHGEVECNACNLYFRKNKRPRPLSLCRDTISKRNRKSVADRQVTN